MKVLNKNKSNKIISSKNSSSSSSSKNSSSSSSSKNSSSSSSSKKSSSSSSSKKSSSSSSKKSSSSSSKKSSSSSSKNSSSSSSSKKSSSSSSKKSSSSSSKKSNKTEKIKKLLSANIQNRSENLGKMLEVTCKNPDNCIALGYYGDVIKRYFDNFQKLDLIDNTSLKRIGRESKNGFIIEVPFKKNNFTAYTALKCSSNEDSDNLLYEYYVGKYFINKYAKMYPCFVETYDLYEFKSNKIYEFIKTTANSNKLSTLSFFKNFITKVDIEEDEPLEDVFGYSCLKNKLLCVLIQHFDNFVSYYDAHTKSLPRINYDIYNIMYQAYFGLAMLGDNYTHYDLHANNVFLYKPFDGNKCILMRYRHNGKVFKFKSEYIVKIIDYGRNYFNNGNTNTKEIMETICKHIHCEPNCGEKTGYNYIQGNIMDPKNFHWINPIVPNVSHDLKFANYIQNKTRDFDLIEKIHYITHDGTSEDKSGDENNIRSIFNLLDALESKIDIFNDDKNEKKYANWTVAATMDVYDDGREYTFDLLPVP
jgi:hypothetical protein